MSPWCAERELSAAHDEEATALLQEIRAYAGEMPKAPARRLQSDDVLLPVHIKKDGLELKFIPESLLLWIQ